MITKISRREIFTKRYQVIANLSQASQLKSKGQSQSQQKLAVITSGGTWVSRGEIYLHDKLLKGLNDKIENYNIHASNISKENLFQDIIKTYFFRLEDLIMKEFEYEYQNYQERLHSNNLSKLIRDGLILTNVKCRPQSILFEEKIIRFQSFQSGKPLPFHRFTNGDIVRISTSKHSSQDYISGIVFARHINYLDVCVSMNDEFPRDAMYRLDLSINQVGYERMLDALEKIESTTKETKGFLTESLKQLILFSFPNGYLQEQYFLKTMLKSSSFKGNKPSVQQTTTNHKKSMTTVADLLYHDDFENNHEFATKLFPSSYQRKSKGSSFSPIFQTGSRLKQMVEPYDSTHSHFFSTYEINQAFQQVNIKKSLNKSQIQAIHNCLVRPISLIQGPPGTGKTKTACKLIETLICLKQQKHNRDKFSKIFVGAHSNTATNNLLEGLGSLGLNVVRLGHLATIPPHLWKHSLDVKVQSTDKLKRMKSKSASLIQSLQDINRMSRDHAYFTHIQANLYEKINELEMELMLKYLQDADVIVSTTTTAGGSILNDFIQYSNYRMSTVLIDEASQCNEVGLLPALMNGCGQLILIGDPKQLPPTVLSPDCQERGLGISLFTRLGLSGLPYYLLQEQYRMHEKIAEFSNLRFYFGKLMTATFRKELQLFSSRNGQRLSSHVPSLGFPWPNPQVPVIFLNVSPVVEASDQSNSKKKNNSVNFDYQYLIEKDQFKTSSTSFEINYDESYYNPHEIELVLQITQRLLQDSMIIHEDYNIGIVTPYNGQVRKLTDFSRKLKIIEKKKFPAYLQTNERVDSFSSQEVDEQLDIEDMKNTKHTLEDLLNNENHTNSSISKLLDQDSQEIKNTLGLFDVDKSNNKKYSQASSSKKSFQSTSKHHNNRDNNNSKKEEEEVIEISSVDGFQGREKDIIIFSSVRSNNQQALGFLKDWRRLNVALTRAKHALIIIGDRNTLEHDSVWSDLLTWCEKEGVVMNVTWKKRK